MAVSRSLAVEKHNIKLSTLITALFYAEDREQEFLELVRRGKRPVTLFALIDGLRVFDCKQPQLAAIPLSHPRVNG